MSTPHRCRQFSHDSETGRITKSRNSVAGRAISLLLIASLAPAGAVAQDSPEAAAPSASKPHRPAAEKKPAGAASADKSRGQKEAPGAPAPAANSQPLSPKPQSEPVGELQPVIHASQAKLTTCMDNVIRQSGQVIDRAHSAISTWSKDAPNENAFQSIVGLTYPNPAAPNGLALIFAAPIGVSKCEGESVQIYPTSQSCSKVHADLHEFGHTIGSVGNLPIVETKDGGRDILIPSAGSGCVIVSVRIH